MRFLTRWIDLRERELRTKETDLRLRYGGTTPMEERNRLDCKMTVEMLYDSSEEESE